MDSPSRLPPQTLTKDNLQLNPEDIPMIRTLEELLEAIDIQTQRLRKINIRPEQTMKYTLPLDQLLRTLHIIKQHILFTLDIIKGESNLEHETAKVDYKEITYYYENVKGREDLNLVRLEYLLRFLREDLLVKLDFELAIYTGFERDRNSQQMALGKKHEAVGSILVLEKKLEIVADLFPKALQTAREDIFSIGKSDKVWKELEAHITHKGYQTKEEVDRSMETTYKAFNVIYAVIKKRSENHQIPDFSSKLSLLKEAMYYFKRGKEAENETNLYITAPNEHVLGFYSVVENPWIKRIAEFKMPEVAYNHLVYLPRLFPKITDELITSEYLDHSINKITRTVLEVPDIAGDKDNALRDILIEGSDKVQVRILAPVDLNIPGIEKGFVGKIKARLPFLGQNVNKVDPEAIVVHIHGGGFASGSSSLSRVFLSPFVNSLNMVHFSIDYRLAPTYKYPEGVDDVWQAYLWIINYAETILGVRHKKVIVTGDSAGGNLALALTLRLIKMGHQVPDGLSLFYPSLSMSPTPVGPSQLLTINDKILPYGTRQYTRKSYTSEHSKPLEDPFLSPLVASDELLAKLPPIRILVGSGDPLYDDNLRFLSRLIKVKNDVRMTVYENLIHGFMSFSDLANFSELLADGCSSIRELLGRDN